MSEAIMVLAVVVGVGTVVLCVLVANGVSGLSQFSAQLCNLTGQVQAQTDQLAQSQQEVAGLAQGAVRLVDIAASSHQELLKVTTESVGGLTRTLEQSHKHFQGVVSALAEPGQLQDWVEALQTVIQPLDAIRLSLVDHYAVSQAVVAATGQILEKWSAERTALEESHARFVELLARWSQDESVSRLDNERRILQRLQEVGTQSQMIAENLSALQTQMQSLTNAVERVNIASERSLTAQERAASVVERVAEGQRALLTEQKQGAFELARLQAETGSALLQVAGQFEDMSGQVRGSLLTMTAEVRQSVALLERQQQADLEATRVSFGETVGSAQGLLQSLLQGQQQFWQQASRAVASLPARADVVSLGAPAFAGMFFLIVLVGMVGYALCR